jgi:hypothetical protein
MLLDKYFQDDSIDFGLLCGELTLLDDYIKAYSPLGKFEGDLAYIDTYRRKLGEYETRTGHKWQGLSNHLERALEYRLRNNSSLETKLGEKNVQERPKI